jgi:hypothetical protein
MVPRAKTLHYDPINEEQHLATHPCEDRVRTNRRLQRQAKQTEKTVERQIAKQTLRSGAALGDGDLCVLEDLRVEVKRRGSRKSWNLTWEELTKGKKQGIDVYAIEIETPLGTRQTVYMLEEGTFTDILARLKISLHKNERIQKTSTETL